MPWKCPACGFADNKQGSKRCEACGFVHFGRLVLVSAETEGRLPVVVDTVIGARLLRTFAGDDHVYAGEPQFLLSRDPVEGGWRIAHAAGAKNPTFLDGAELAEAPVPLVDAATVSIGPERLRIRIEIEE